MTSDLLSLAFHLRKIYDVENHSVINLLQGLHLLPLNTDIPETGKKKCPKNPGHLLKLIFTKDEISCSDIQLKIYKKRYHHILSLSSISNFHHGFSKISLMIIF